MTGGSLLLLMLLVSWTSLVLQTAALLHLWRQRAGYRAEELAGRGYVRTASSRVLLAAFYVTLAVAQATGTHLFGVLTAEALVALTVNQSVWLANAALDVRLRRKLGQPAARPDTAGKDQRAGRALASGCHGHIMLYRDLWCQTGPLSLPRPARRVPSLP